MASYNKPDELITDTELADIVERTIPAYAYRGSGREWTWTRPAGVWKIHLSTHPDRTNSDRIITARLESAGSIPVLKTGVTRREVNAALRWLVLVDAIDRHPDDPIAGES